MKRKYACTAILSILLLILFLPVFFCVIYYGTNFNYNELHKIVAVQGNRFLLMCVLFGTVAIGILYYFLRKIPYTRRTVTCFVIITSLICIVFYWINVNISKCIAFYGGWDCGMVANSARWIFEGNDLGYDDYYTIYSNNIPITWLLYKLYCISSGMTSYPYNPEFIWIQFQCVMLSLAVLFAVLFVLKISKHIGTAVIALLFNICFLGISPWKIIPYTDGTTIAMPILLLFLYAVFRSCHNKRKYFLWFFMMFVGIFSGIMKATCYVALIAIVLAELLWSILDKKIISKKIGEIGLKLLLLVMAFGLAYGCKLGIYHTLHYDYNADMEIGWSNYLYNGLNEETTGACSGEGLEIVRSFAGAEKSDRMNYEIEGIRNRIQNRGFLGTIQFLLRKQVMNFNDGTFSWYQEGYFQAWEYPDLTDSRFKESLRDFYWQDGKNYIWYTTVSQGLWIFVLLGIVTEAFLILQTAACGIRNSDKINEENDSDQLCLSLGTIVTFIGIYLFVMLFEARARYLYNYIPVFSAMAVLGYCKLYQKFILFFDQKRN